MKVVGEPRRVIAVDHDADPDGRPRADDVVVVVGRWAGALGPHALEHVVEVLGDGAESIRQSLVLGPGAAVSRGVGARLKVGVWLATGRELLRADERIVAE